MMAESGVSLSVATGAVSLLTAEGPASRAARTHTPTPSYKGGGANHRERRTPPPVLPVLTTPQTPKPLPCLLYPALRHTNSGRVTTATRRGAAFASDAHLGKKYR